MTPQNRLTIQSIHPASLGKQMVQGAGIALILIALFLLGVKNPKPEWGNLWMIKPLLVVPFAGSMGGVFYYYMNHLCYRGGWRKAVAIILSLIGYIVILWLGTVLGLNGTLWN